MITPTVNTTSYRHRVGNTTTITITTSDNINNTMAVFGQQTKIKISRTTQCDDSSTNGPAITIMLDKVNKRIFQDCVNINSSDGTKQ